MSEPLDSTGIAPKQSGNALKKRCLPCAFGPDDTDHVAGVNVEVDFVEGKRPAVSSRESSGECACQTADPKYRLC